jgi:hypothetical protein
LLTTNSQCDVGGHFPHLTRCYIYSKNGGDFLTTKKGNNMSIQTSKVRNGAMIALGAAALILSGCATTGTNTASSAQGVCVGANSCKGTSECKTAGNDCKGHNACKTVLNACKGQGSCKTAGNACKGQNSCKGKGHLALTGAECDAQSGHMV